VYQKSIALQTSIIIFTTKPRKNF